MSKGLKIASNYYNKIEAWKDFEAVAAVAIAGGMGDLVEQVRPDSSASWRVIDKATAQIKQALVPVGEQS